MTEDEVQGDVVAAVDLDGHLVVSYFAPGHDAIRLLRCVDTACAEPPSIVFLDFLGYSEPIDMALRPDGRAIVIAQSADFLSATVYECDDAECNLAGLDEFVDEAACEWDDGRPCSRADFVQMAIAPDGLPRIAYYHGNPPTLKLAVCGDPTCLAENRTTVVIDDDLTGYGRPALRISPAGRVLIGYGTGDGETSEARVAVCEDAACSTGPTIHKFSDASMARTTWGAGDEFLVWYRTGPEGPSGPIDFDDIWGSWSGFADIMMAECSPDGCAEPVRIEAGEDWLIPWMAGIDILETANSGTVAVFNHIAQNDSDLRLRLTRCADQTCTSAVTEKLGVDAVFGWSFDAVVHDGSLWIVFAEEAGGLHLAEVPLDV